MAQRKRKRNNISSKQCYEHTLFFNEYIHKITSPKKKTLNKKYEREEISKKKSY